MHILSRKAFYFPDCHASNIACQNGLSRNQESRKIHDTRDVYQYPCVLSKCTLASGVSM